MDGLVEPVQVLLEEDGCFFVVEEKLLVRKGGIPEQLLSKSIRLFQVRLRPGRHRVANIEQN